MAIIVSVAEYFAQRPFDALEDVTILDTGANISALTPAQFQELGANNVDFIDAIDDALTISIDHLIALGAVTLTAGDTVTLADFSVVFEGGDTGSAASLAGLGIDVIDAIDNQLTFSAAMLAAFGPVQFSPDDTLMMADTAANIALLTPGDFAGFTAQGADAFGLADTAAVWSSLTPVEIAGFQSQGITRFILADTADNLALLTPDAIELLSAKGLDTIDVTTGPLSLSVAQFLAFGAANFRGSDAVGLLDTGAALSTLTDVQIGALTGKGIDSIDASDDVLTLTLAQFSALGSVQLAPDDLVTIADSASALSVLLDTDVANIRGLGVDVFVISDTVANLDALFSDAVALAAFVTAGIDEIAPSDGPLTVDLADIGAMGGIVFSAASNIILSDAGADLAAADFAALAARGVDVLDASDDAMTLTTAQFAALGAVTLTGADVVTLAGTGAAFNAMTPLELSALAGKGIDKISATDNALNLSPAQLTALGSVTINSGQSVTLSGAGSTFSAMSIADLAALAGAGVGAIDASDDVLSLSLAQLNALGTVKLTGADTVTVSDSGAVLSWLSPASIATLASQGIDRLDANDNAFNFSVAQFKALGPVQLTGSDAVLLSDSGAAISGLSAGELQALPAKGIDAIQASGTVALSLDQYNALSLPVSGGSVAVFGTSSGNRIVGKFGNDIIKGLSGNDRISGGIGDDLIFGGNGKDTLTGNSGRDAFVFDTRPSKKSNVDKITDFNVKYDSVYLDNAIFKKLGKGSEDAPRKLKKAYFTIGDKAKDKNDYMIYDKKKGVLYYDSDGSGSKAQVEIATLKKNLKMSYNDFFVV